MSEQDIALQAYEQAVTEYIQKCRDAVPDFVTENYSFLSSLKLHKHALGHDLWRAPANLFLALPNLGLIAGAQVLQKSGAPKSAKWVKRRVMSFKTNVSRELQARLYRDLLCLPYKQDQLHLEKDGFAENLFDQHVIQTHLTHLLKGAQTPDKIEQFRQNLIFNLTSYTDSRSAAADIANQVMTLSVGAALFKQTTPGALSLGPLLASSFAHHAAITTFPLGASLGGLWYGVFPATASTGLTLATTGAVMGASAVLTAFSGIVTDPVQKALGLHHKRLHQLIDCIEQELQGAGESDFAVKDHYIARLMDFLDIVRLARQQL